MNRVLEYIQCASGNGVQQNFKVAFEWNQLAAELELGKFMVMQIPAIGKICWSPKNASLIMVKKFWWGTRYFAKHESKSNQFMVVYTSIVQGGEQN